jgi:hypothetical protein
MKNLLIIVFALLLGFGMGLAYSWGIAPVEYVDASPVLLRSDFKDQYRIVIAAAYASSHDLARARARLELTSNTDPLADLKGQAQRMVGSGDAAGMELLVQLASDLQKGVAGIPLTSTPDGMETHAPVIQTSTMTGVISTFTPLPVEPTFTPVSSNNLTPFVPPQFTLTPKPTQTAAPNAGTPFVLVGQDEVCDPGIQPGLMQFKFLDSHRRQVAGVEIVVISVASEDHFFTGFKPEVGDGYADFVMQENTSYSIRIVEGGTFLTNITAPTCTDPNGTKSLGGLSLSFQQP